MTKGFLEGLIKPEINTDIDVSTEKNTYNIGSYIEIKIDKLVIADKEIAKDLMFAVERLLEPPQEPQPQE